MKKRILFPFFFVMMCAAFVNACFADAPKIKLYDFSEKNSTCYWTTDLSPSEISGDDWVGTTNKVNNTISLNTSSSPIKGSEYPYFVFRVKYEIPDGADYQPISHAYFKIVDETGNTVADLWQQNGVNQSNTMKASDNGKYVTYFYDMSGNSTYMENYISQTVVGIGMYYKNVKVAMDFAAYAPEKNVTVTFTDPADNALSLPDPAKIEIGSSMELTGYTAQKEGNRLLGWVLTPNATETIDRIDCIKNNLTLYAIWEKAETVKVTYHTDEQSEIVLKNPGDRLYSPITPTRDDGLIFYGWSASADSSEVLPYATTVTKATEVYAVWGEGFEWNFDTDGDTENTTPDQITGVTVQDGALRGTTSGNDPKIFLRFIADFGHFNTVVVQGTANSENEADGAWFQVYAALDKKPLAEERSVNKKFTYTDGLSELRYSLYNDMRVASSYKNITFFRLDPGSRSDINLCIERIFVIPDVPAAALFDAADGTGQMPRILPDTNGYITLPESIFTHSYKEFEAWTDGTNTFLPGTKVKIDSFVTFYPKWKEGKIRDLDTEFYPGFTKKAFVLSYDDGVDYYDRILLGRLNNAGYVGSFNIITSYWDSLTEEQLDTKRTMYAGHEIANHSDTHPQMVGKDSTTGEFLFTEEECINDIVLGKEKLEKVFGYEVVGLAWPFTIPSTRPNIRKHVRENYIYARGSGDSYNFNIPASFVDEWTFTIYEARYKGGLLEYTKKYQTYDSDALSLFSVWGHSFDFTNGTSPAITYAEYDEFLTLCKTIDMWNPTCADYVRYVNAHRKMVIDYENVYNPSELTQYIQANGMQIELPAGARYDGETIHCNTAVAAESEIRVTVNLDTRKATGETASVLAAAYDEHGKLIGVKAYEIPSGKIQTASLTLPSSSGAATVKVFLFNDLTVFSPLEEVKIVPVTAE